MTNNAEALLTRIRQQKEEAGVLKELYSDLFPPEFVPEDRQFLIWLQRYDMETIAASLERTVAWYSEAMQNIEEFEAKGKKIPDALYKNKLDILKYASGVMKGKANEALKQ